MLKEVIEGMFFHILSKFGKFHDFANFCRSRTKLAPKKVKNKGKLKLFPGMGQNIILSQMFLS